MASSNSALGVFYHSLKLSVAPYSCTVLAKEQAGNMAFPMVALLVGVGVAVVMVALGQWNGFASLCTGLVVFLILGGLQYVRMVIKYLPRDLW